MHEIAQALFLGPDGQIGVEADGLSADPLADDLLDAVKGTAADKQDVGRVDLHEFLLRMLAAALRRHGSHRSLEDLEQSLLNTLAGYITGNRNILRFLGNLIDLIDIDDARLRQFNIIVRRLNQLQQNVVASAMANGTLSIRARDCASSVLPEPVGPTMIILLFCSSTSDFTSE